jgi:RNA polymerase sigma factor (TIGR02999 family)
VIGVSGASPRDVTLWLRAWQQGDRQAEERLLAETYDELKRLARAQLRGERPGHTLQPTALVHEAYARMTGLTLEWKDRVHYLSMAARCMRRVLVDHARKRGAGKRGAGAERVTLDGEAIRVSSREVDLLDLDRALERLARENPQAATAIELHYFAGLGQAEIAEATGVSESTTYRTLRFARAWLRNALDR